VSSVSRTGLAWLIRYQVTLQLPVLSSEAWPGAGHLGRLAARIVDGAKLVADESSFVRAAFAIHPAGLRRGLASTTVSQKPVTRMAFGCARPTVRTPGIAETIGRQGFSEISRHSSTGASDVNRTAECRGKAPGIDDIIADPCVRQTLPRWFRTPPREGTIPFTRPRPRGVLSVLLAPGFTLHLYL